MNYRIEIDRQALKVLAALPKEAIWRIRSGSYRVAYTVQRNVLHILILRIADRKDFYRHFKR
jgi:mRNA-degrading endonuclease RelE of RelBE toxin-antitoxin system